MCQKGRKPEPTGKGPNGQGAKKPTGVKKPVGRLGQNPKWTQSVRGTIFMVELVIGMRAE